ncbi:hypothetical protein EVAR_68801_1 [Eumeta japonica]|uniref:Uncharacterized protein n=1 Tax=Eumeta variegata TaxID=151549 RepID=A0A4C1ZU08_EUMVA|nr:hypothetical protein EVAR_68801_1 [Eumeta japonica]
MTTLVIRLRNASHELRVMTIPCDELDIDSLANHYGARENYNADTYNLLQSSSSDNDRHILGEIPPCKSTLLYGRDRVSLFRLGYTLLSLLCPRVSSLPGPNYYSNREKFQMPST